MKGPVPTAALLRSPCFFTPASLMMKPQNPPSAASRPANGSLVMNFTACRPAGSTLSTAMKSDLPGDFSKRRSNVNLTSADVISWPSWNLTPWRSLNVQVSPSGLTCQDSASSGTGVISGSKRTSWLYIIGERALRENAGTSWGSSPVASVVRAEMNVPPAFGVWAKAPRAPSESAPSVRPPAWSSWRRVSLWVMSSSSGVRIENVPQAVTDQVEGQDGDHDGDHRAVHPRPAHRGDAHREQQSRNAEEHVHHTVDRVVPGAAGVAGHEPQRPADQHRQPDRGHRHVERDARAVDHPAQHVTPEPVGAEQRLAAGSRLDEVEVLLVGRIRRQRAGEQRHGHDHQREDRPDH